MLPQVRRPLSAGCCHAGASSTSRRGWEIVAGALSLGVWVLVPKCPVCVAAHVAFWTGLGLSLTVAAHLRWSLLLLSGLALFYLALKRSLRALAARRAEVASQAQGRACH
jgi:hypothetical protein